MDRLRKIEEEVEDLKSALAGLRLEIGELRDELRARKHPLEVFLKQRGLAVMSHGELSQVLLPPNTLPAQKENFYMSMRRYSFRLFLRDLIQFPEGQDIKTLSRYCSLGTVRSYLKFLAEIKVVEILPNSGYRLTKTHITSFGPTLEWYVCEIFRREFLAPALFNVRIRHTRHGGDYDVIALIAGHLVYVEVKSSPPRGVEIQAVSAFVNRLQDIQPHMSVFLVDTELRMKDKIVPLFAEALESSRTDAAQPPVERLVNEIFHIDHNIYLTNSQKGIYSNLRCCIRDFLNWEKHNGISEGINS